MKRKSMNIMIITPIYPPLTGGAATYFQLMLRQFEQKELSVFLLTRVQIDAPLIERGENLTIFRFLVPGLGFGNRYPRLSWIASQLNRVIIFLVYFYLHRKYRIDIIHAHIQIYHAFPKTLANFRKKSKVLIDIRGYGAIPEDNKDLHSLSECSNAVICATQNVHRAMLKTDLKEKCHYIPIPFQSPHKRQDSEVRQILMKYDLWKKIPYICYAGSIVPSKGIYELINGFTQLSRKDRYSNLSLVLVGKNMMGKKFIHRINSDSQIVWTGPIPHNDALALIQGSELLVLPSRSEGLPRVCLEAMALGKKVLAPPGVPEFEHLNKIFSLNSINSNELSHKISLALENEEIPNFDFETHKPEKVVGLTLNLYKQILQGN